MPRFFVFLIIPFIFTFVFDSYFSNIKTNQFDSYSITKIKKDNIIDVHKDFSFNFNSSTINKIYSEKIIQNFHEENIVNLKPKVKINYIERDKIVNLTNSNEKDHSLYLISSDWQSNFSNKKIKFIETVLPLISFENHKIILERKKLLSIRNFLTLEKTLKNEELKYLRKISKKYDITTKNKHKIDIINELLLNVNVIPNSIVLAQAANESGWGTSRFAREYNALFGQYTYDEKSGVVPFKREKGKKHLIKNFSSIHKSVESYFKNINSHYAYKKFRSLRSYINDFDNDFNIKIWTNSLDVYAEDESYVDTINKIIDTNNLNQFDSNLKIFFNS